jgi:ribonuclease HII
MIFAGIDEVGRGAIFGAVVACAIILPPDCQAQLRSWGVTDSKKLSPKQRQQLAPKIKAIAQAWQIGSASVQEIEQLNILRATFLAMERALMALCPRPDHLWVDGNQPISFQYIQPIPQTTIVGGDRQNLTIACASIIAKVWRDQQLQHQAREYPHYHLERNKGYGTAQHRQAIRIYGLSDQHRPSFCQRII